MQQKKLKPSVHDQIPKFRSPVKHKILVSDEVVVVNPVTKLEERKVVNTYMEEAELASNLRESDFSLQVQIKHNVDLKDCGKFFIPSTPEEYVAQIARLTSNADSFFAPDSDPDSAPDPAPDPVPSDSDPKVVEPTKTE